MSKPRFSARLIGVNTRVTRHTSGHGALTNAHMREVRHAMYWANNHGYRPSEVVAALWHITPARARYWLHRCDPEPPF